MRIVYLFQHSKSKFMDNIRVYVKGGTGGKGFSKYGGIGGRGGHVYVEAVERTTLLKLYSENPDKRFTAGVGKNSRYKVY